MFFIATKILCGDYNTETCILCKFDATSSHKLNMVVSLYYNAKFWVKQEQELHLSNFHIANVETEGLSINSRFYTSRMKIDE